VHLAFTFPWIKASDPRYHTSIILEKLLGDTYSSRLWQKIREEKGLVYSLGLDVTSFLDCGYLCLTMATAPSNIEKLIKITFQEIKKLKENPFSKAELDIFKRQAEISILLATEDSVGLLENMLNSELIHNKQISTQELISSIKKVTPYHIQELANEFFLSNRAGLICLGKVDKDTLSSLYLDAIESLKS
jgi:predicted Zn-dependent peptidase